MKSIINIALIMSQFTQETKNNARRTNNFAQSASRWLTLAIGLLMQPPSRNKLFREPVAQLVERLTFNEDVHGSNPCGLTIPLLNCFHTL